MNLRLVRPCRLVRIRYLLRFHCRYSRSRILNRAFRFYHRDIMLLGPLGRFRLIIRFLEVCGICTRICWGVTLLSGNNSVLLKKIKSFINFLEAKEFKIKNWFWLYIFMSLKIISLAKIIIFLRFEKIESNLKNFWEFQKSILT